MLVEEEQFQALGIHEFHECVDRMIDPRVQIMVKGLYLLCARVSEVVTRGSPYDILNGSSKPMGSLITWETQDFPFNEKKEKILVVKMPVAKRTKVTRKDREKAKLQEQPSPEDIEKAFMRFGLTKMVKKYRKGEIKPDPLIIAQLLGKIHYKTLALPIDPKYDGGWCFDLFKYLGKNKYNLNFKWTRQTSSTLIKEELKRVGLGNWHAHLIRHQRISDLINTYNLLPAEITSIAGWTLRSTYQGMGMAVSSNLDNNASLNFKSYLPKLLVDFNTT